MSKIQEVKKILGKERPHIHSHALWLSEVSEEICQLDSSSGTELKLIGDEGIKDQIKFLYEHNPFMPIESMLEALCKSIAETQLSACKEQAKGMLDRHCEDCVRWLDKDSEIQKAVDQAREQVAEKIIREVELLNPLLLRFDAVGNSYTEIPLKDTIEWQALKSRYTKERKHE